MRYDTSQSFCRVVLVGLVFLLIGEGAWASESGQAGFEFELEGGPVWQSRNDVQVPNTELGTRFSLVDVVGNGPFPTARLYVTWNIARRHSLRALAAPLSISDTGLLDQRVQFEGETFEAGVPTKATYRFNSWRVSYRYNFYDGTSWRWWVGFTAKIRDAKIELGQPGVNAKKTDVGFVPLLHISARYRLSEKWVAELDADALAGGPGRAEDVAVKIGYDISGRWGLRLGYRTVEGGADVEEVYNFAWLHYAVVSAEFRY